MSYEQEFLREFEAWVNSQVTINEMAMLVVKSLKKIKMSVQQMPIFVMKANWMPINLSKENLKIIRLAKDFTIYQTVFLVREIIDF